MIYILKFVSKYCATLLPVTLLPHSVIALLDRAIQVKQYCLIYHLDLPVKPEGDVFLFLSCSDLIGGVRLNNVALLLQPGLSGVNSHFVGPFRLVGLKLRYTRFRQLSTPSRIMT